MRLFLGGRDIESPVGIEGGDSGHLFIGETEIEDIHVGPEVIGVVGARNRDEAFLDVPAQDDLGDGFPVGAGDVLEDFFLEEAVFGMAERIVRHHFRSVGGKSFKDCLFAAIGVGFQLDDVGLDFRLREDGFELFSEEIGKADGPDETFFVGLLQLPISGEEVARGMVEQKDVDIVDPEAFERPFDAIRISEVGWPYLRDDEKIFPPVGKIFQCPSYRPFVEIDVRRVDETIACLQGKGERLSRLPGEEMVGPIADRRHPDAVGKGDEFHGNLLFYYYKACREKGRPFLPQVFGVR